MEIILDGKKIMTEDDFYNELCKQHEDFGDYFGRNLDAFNDYIGLLEEWRIIWNDSETSKKTLGKSFLHIVDIINEHNSRIINSNRDKRLLIRLDLK